MIKEIQIRLDKVGLSKHSFYVNTEDEGLSADLQKYGIREAANVRILVSFIQNHKETAVIDVGSNIGYFPLIEHMSGAKRIIAIEPVRENYVVLLDNLNQARERVACHNKAVSYNGEDVTMYIGSHKNLASCIEPAIYSEVVRVQSLTIPQIIIMNNLGGERLLLRMDVEGYELYLLKNLPLEVKYLLFEFHSHAMSEENARDLIKSIVEQGFVIKKISIQMGKIMNQLVKWFGVPLGLRMLSVYRKFEFNNPEICVLEELIHRMEVFHVLAERR